MIVYMLANGQGKARARQDGSARNAFDWRLLFLSTGEITLADKVREDPRQRALGGQAVRVLDIPADTGVHGLFENLHRRKSSQAFADDLITATQRYYGTPIRAFLAEVTARRDEVAEQVQAYQLDILGKFCSKDAHPQVSRAAKRFALAAAAGELATALGITGWKQETATKAARVCFQAYIARRGHTGSAETAAGIEQVRKFFALHGEARFSRPDKPDLIVRDRAGFLKDGQFWVFPEVFRDEIARGADWHLLADALIEHGFLIAGENGKPQRKVRDPADMKRSVRMLCFTPAVLSTPEDGAGATAGYAGETEAIL
jgi:putative DNA primase/helicase